MRFAASLGMILALGLVGCGEQQSGGGPDNASVSRQLQPADAALSGIYNRSCRSCHTVAATGAPLSGDQAAWHPRLDKGIDTLVDNVINGFGGMPPLGLCMDCEVEQFEALIRFMAAGHAETP